MIQHCQASKMHTMSYNPEGKQSFRWLVYKEWTYQGCFETFYTEDMIKGMFELHHGHCWIQYLELMAYIFPV